MSKVICGAKSEGFSCSYNKNYSYWKGSTCVLEAGHKGDHICRKPLTADRSHEYYPTRGKFLSNTHFAWTNHRREQHCSKNNLDYKEESSINYHLFR